MESNLVAVVSSNTFPENAVAATAYTSGDAIIYDEKRFTLPCGKRIHRFELDQLLWAAGRIPKSGKVLELGCGTGRLLVELVKQGWNVDGADASAAMLEQLKRKTAQLGKKISTRVVPAANTELNADQYDLTYAIRLLNQTESPEYALNVVREMIRVTKPGGFVLAEFVNDYRPRWGKASRPRRQNPTRLKPAEVLKVGESCSAEVVGCRGSFFLGMQAYHASPTWLLPLVSLMDRGLSAMFPRLCARTYLLFRKTEG
jgi:SAM-dependent methyltransferase